MRRLIVLVVTVATALVAAPAVSHAATYTESFEQGFGGWEPRSDGLAPKWSVTRSTDRPFHGLWGLRYDIDGTQDDGTVWVQRRFPVTATTKTVELRFWMWSDREAVAGNWKIVAYIGAKQPVGEGDFATLGETNRWKGWREFVYRVPLSNSSSFGVTVAFGLSVLWEVTRTDYFDLTTVTIT